MYCWSLAWRILSITLLACEMSAIVWQFEHSLALPFFGIGMKTDHFQSCGHCLVFSICWHNECSVFTELSFRIWNSSTGIPSLPLTLFIVMLPKAHLTLHSLPCVPLQISSCKQSPPRTSCLRPVLTTAHQLAEITWKSAVGCDLPSSSSLGALPFLLSPELSSLSIWSQKLFISLQFFHFPPCHSSWPFF